MHKILIAIDSFTEEHVSLIHQASAGWAVCTRVDQNSERDYQRLVGESTVVVGWTPSAWLVESPVQFFQLASVGYDPYLHSGLDEKPNFQLCNLGDIFCLPVAEHFIGTMFCLARCLHKHAEDRLAKRWQRQLRYEEIEGSTICIVGVGGIGTAIARRCKALGMNVIGVGRHPDRLPKELLSQTFAWDDMKNALAVADHVVLSFPGTAANARMFDASMFGAMKSGAFFYNVGRGIVVDEDALFTALKSRHLGGAAIDVFQQEPLQADHPLWDVDNILITPHSAGRSVKEFDRICDLFVRNLQRLEKGEPLLNRIDLSNE